MTTEKAIQIYRATKDPNSCFTDVEICRDCIEKFKENENYIEFDGHLCKYVYEQDGFTFYSEGGEDDGTDNEINCSVCGESFITDKDMLELPT